jgi:hypothetical protein
MSSRHLIFQTRNPWNSKLGFNKKTYFPINLMLKDVIKKYLNLKKIKKVKQIAIKK